MQIDTSKGYWVRIIGQPRHSGCGSLAVVLGQYDTVLATAIVHVSTCYGRMLATGVEGNVSGYVPPDITRTYRCAYQPPDVGAFLEIINALDLTPRRRTGRQKFALPVSTGTRAAA